MKMTVSINSALRLRMMAALLASLAAPVWAAPANVVISQLYGAGGNAGASYNKDFIELFNRSAVPQSLAGMSVQYQSAAGSTWQATALPNVTLQPGQYFLVTGASGVAGADVGVGDVSGSLNLSGTTGKVALSSQPSAMLVADGGDKIVDLVGFGTANRFEGAVAPAPSSTTSIKRASQGCVDTDNNASDFSAGLIDPRRAGSPRITCGGAIAQPIVTDCPLSISTQQGVAALGVLKASDADSIVNAASITGGALAGIALTGLAPAAAVGASASVNLEVGVTLPGGSYPLVVTFGNSDAQSLSCTVTVKVAGAHTIPQIQGAGATSPYQNTVQTTSGVITLKLGSGFFIQDQNGDGDPTTSDAIFVFGASTAAIPGDLVSVTGTISEFTPGGANRSYTEFKDTTAISFISSGHTITPINISLPNADLARSEAMLVHFAVPLTINEVNYVGARGELTLAAGRREVPTNRYPAGSSEAVALAAANAANLLVLDDGIFITPSVIPYIGDGATVRVGDTVSNLTGVLDFGAVGGGGAAFKLQPTVAPAIVRANPRTAGPQLPSGNVRVASTNVLNFFTTFTDGSDVNGASGQGCLLGGATSKNNCRGADNLAEFIRQRDKIVNELKAINADVVGLMEIQNNGDSAVATLVNSLNSAIGAPAYSYVPAPASTGTDAIRVAMIYKPAVLTLVGGALSDGDPINNRPPMAQTFKAANGATFSVIVNHLKSKASCPGGSGVNTENGYGQGCWNGVRVQQAQRLVSAFVPQVLAAAGDPDVLLIGDLNSHGFEDPINVLTGAGLVNELERFVRPNGLVYSYVFDGESGYLDHALATASLDVQVAGATEWHNNADEPEVIDYNTDGKPQDLYVNNAYRASDHDPVVLSLNLTPTFVDTTSGLTLYRSGLSFNRNTQQYAGTLSLTNKTAGAITGPFQIVLGALPAGVTLANAVGSHDGPPYVSVNGVDLAPGATLSVNLVFNNPSKTAIPYSPIIFSGAF